jgi:hypothetical protein
MDVADTLIDSYTIAHSSQAIISAESPRLYTYKDRLPLDSLTDFVFITESNIGLLLSIVKNGPA